MVWVNIGWVKSNSIPTCSTGSRGGTRHVLSLPNCTSHRVTGMSKILVRARLCGRLNLVPHPPSLMKQGQLTCQNMVSTSPIVLIRDVPATLSHTLHWYICHSFFLLHLDFPMFGPLSEIERIKMDSSDFTNSCEWLSSCCSPDVMYISRWQLHLARQIPGTQPGPVTS